MAKRKKKKTYGPVSILIFMIVGVAILSFVLSLISFGSNQTQINGNVLEANLVLVKNIISGSGVRYLIGSIVTNFRNFEPLAVIIISLIGIGICEKSGLLNAMFAPLKKVKFGVVIFFTILLGIISTVIGDYSYLFLLPFVGVMYKYLDKNPILGILTIYLGITLGYGTGIIYNYNDYVLGTITQSAASFDVDKSYTYKLFSNIYIMIGSTLLLSFVLTTVINRFIVPKYPKKRLSSKEEQELNVSSKGLTLTFLSCFLLILIVIYMVLDIDLPLAGILLAKDGNTYIAKLFGNGSPFKEGIVIIIAFIMMIAGFIYGKVSGNIKDSNEYSLGLSKNFENLGFMFVLMFFISQVIAVIDWTNIGVVISSKLTEFMSSMQVSGLPLIIIFFFVVILSSIFIPDAVIKWQLMAPTVIPLFMRSNITPDFTQFIFKVADSVGKACTPLFIYFIIMLAFLEKYRIDDKKQVSIFGVLKSIAPTVILIMVFWLILLCLWYIVNFPIGVGTYTTI